MGLELTVHLKKGGGRFTGAHHILDHTLIPSVVRLAGILYGQIAAIDDADALVAATAAAAAAQIQSLSVLAPGDLRFR